MSWELIAILMFGGLLVLLATGLPVAFSLGGIGLAAAFLIWGPKGAIVLASTAYDAGENYLLIALPLFILMGETAVVSGVTRGAFKATDAIAGRLPGGLAITTIGTACIFGAVSGASSAACAAVGTMALPEMFRRGYDKGLAVGAVGGGAVLDILIPPSVAMVVYGYLSGVSIGKLFFAGFVPGFVSAGMFSLYIMLRCLLNPRLAPERSRAGLKETMTSLVGLLPLLTLIVVALGSIWFGIATASEAAGIGAFGSMLLALGYRTLNWQAMKKIMLSTARMSCMIFTILIGATFFTQILVYVGVAASLAEVVIGLQLPAWVIVTAMMLILIFLGCFIDTGSMLFITTPIFMPVVHKLGLDPLWFGILVMMACELATLTPPVGFNLFVLKGVAPEMSFADIVKGVAPYWFLVLGTMVLCGIFPILVTWLPDLMKPSIG